MKYVSQLFIVNSHQLMKLWIIFLIPFTISSCLSSKVYMPTSNPGQGLFFEEKGDAMLSLNTSTYDASAYSTDLQAAINLTKRIGIGLYATDYDFAYFERTRFQDHTYREIFLVLDPFKNEGHKQQEIVFGIGMGRGEERDMEESFGFGGDLDVRDFVRGRGNYAKYSAQYAAGSNKKNVEAGVSLKASFIDMYSYSLEEYKNSITTLDIIPKKGVFIEPSFFYRLGIKSAKVGIQAGVTSQIIRSNFNYNKYYLSVGLSVRPEQLFRLLTSDK